MEISCTKLKITQNYFNVEDILNLSMADKFYIVSERSQTLTKMMRPADTFSMCPRERARLTASVEAAL